MTQEELSAIYSAAQGVIDKYADESSSSYGKEQEAKKYGAKPSGREGPSKEERSLSRQIQREVKRALATGRTERLNEALKAQQNQKNYTDNNSPSSSIYQSPAQNEPPKISRITPPPRPPLPPTETKVKDTFDGSGGSNGIQPWDLLLISNNKIKVQAGTLNSILPSNWNQEFAVGTGLHYAKAVITTDGEAITKVEIQINTQAPVAQKPQEFSIDSKIEYLFGLFASGQVYRVIGDGHISLPTRTWLVTSASPPAAAGQSPYDIYYLLGP